MSDTKQNNQPIFSSEVLTFKTFNYAKFQVITILFYVIQVSFLFFFLLWCFGIRTTFSLFLKITYFIISVYFVLVFKQYKSKLSFLRQYLSTENSVPLEKIVKILIFTWQAIKYIQILLLLDDYSHFYLQSTIIYHGQVV